MTPTGARTVERSIHRLLQDCGNRWGIRGFEQTVRIEWDGRFRRSLGRVHLERRVVRLSMDLAAAPIEVLLEVVCHEAAHLAARELCGSRCRPHGPEWGTLVRAAGFEPRPQIPWAPPSPAQFGRGLRKAEHKDHLTVVDYIGNHRTFLLKPQVLLGLASSASAVAEALTRAEAHSLDLPPGCEVTYDLRAIEILRALLPRTPDVLRAWYEDFRERHGTRPRAVEAFHDGYAPRSVRQSHGSWLRFVDQMGDLPESQATMVKGIASGPAGVPRAQDFLEELETSPMTKSYTFPHTDQTSGGSILARRSRRSSTLPTTLLSGTKGSSSRTTA